MEDINTINKTEFEELCRTVPVPCIVITNDENGLTLAAYDFAWENSTAALIKLPYDSRYSQLSLGQCVRYQKSTPVGAKLFPSEPLDADSIRRLENARREFLPKLYAD